MLDFFRPFFYESGGSFRNEGICKLEPDLYLLP